MDNYKPNSNKYKAEQKKEEKNLQKIVNSPVKVKKKSGITKLTDIFVAEDASSVKSYIITDVLIPNIKKLIADVIHDGADMILYGITGSSKDRGVKGSYVSYNNYYKSKPRDLPATKAISPYSYDDIILKTRGDAEAVLREMHGLIEEYGMVSISDLHEYVGLPSNFTDNKYGWMSLNTASVKPVREGYLLNLPRVVPLD